MPFINPCHLLSQDSSFVVLSTKDINLSSTCWNVKTAWKWNYRSSSCNCLETWMCQTHPKFRKRIRLRPPSETDHWLCKETFSQFIHISTSLPAKCCSNGFPIRKENSRWLLWIFDVNLERYLLRICDIFLDKVLSGSKLL